MADSNIPTLDDDQRTFVRDNCLASAVRRADRAVTQLYDDALRTKGLRTTQFNLLIAIASTEPVRQKALALRMGMDKTTLTRNLRPLERDGLVRVDQGEDRRTRNLSLTDKGHRTLHDAYALWRRAQGQAEALLGGDRVRDLVADLRAAVITLG